MMVNSIQNIIDFCGLKQPSDRELAALLKYIHEKFKSYTSEKIEQIFHLAAEGKLGIELNKYHLTGMEFAKVMYAYRNNYDRPKSQTHNEVKEVTEEEKKRRSVQWRKDFQQQYKNFTDKEDWYIYMPIYAWTWVNENYKTTIKWENFESEARSKVLIYNKEYRKKYTDEAKLISNVLVDPLIGDDKARCKVYCCRLAIKAFFEEQAMKGTNIL